MDLKVVKQDGNSGGSAKVPSVLEIKEVNRHIIWEVVKAEQANKRQCTHKTKVKGEVRGGGRKPWRQKGTGRARAGSNRSPIWVGGGTTFGPQPRSYREEIPRKKRRVAYRHILAEKLNSGKVVVLDSISFEKPSTKGGFSSLTSILKAADFNEALESGRKIRANSNKRRRKVVLVGFNESDAVKRSLRNIPWVEMIDVQRLAAVPLFYNHGLIITKSALAELETRLRV